MDAIKEIVRLTERIKKTKDNLKKREGRLEDLKKQLNLTMVLTDTQSITRHGFTVKPETKRYCTMKKEYEPELLTQLKAHKYGDLIKETVHYRALSGLYEEIKDNQDLREITSKLNVHEVSTVSLRRTGGN